MTGWLGIAGFWFLTDVVTNLNYRFKGNLGGFISSFLLANHYRVISTGENLRQQCFRKEKYS